MKLKLLVCFFSLTVLTSKLSAQLTGGAISDSKQTGDMVGHSHSDAMSFNIGFFWSPPTVINTVVAP